MKLGTPKEKMWFKYPHDETFEVELRRMPVPVVDKLKRRCRPANAIDADEVIIERWIEIMAEQFIADWRGLHDEDTGEPIPYNKQNAVKLLTQNMQIMQFVAETSTNIDRFFGNGTVSARTDS